MSFFAKDKFVNYYGNFTVIFTISAESGCTISTSMCGRYSLNVINKQHFIDGFEIEGTAEEVQSSWNIAPSQLQPVVLSHSPNHIEMMQWGLIPFWERDETPHGLINLRDDTVLAKKWAHRYLQEQRCLVPATGFYEWKKTPEGKQPYNFRVKNQYYFAMAGLYSIWKHPTSGQEIHSYAIITTKPNELMSHVHNRMPVIIKREAYRRWLSHDLFEVEHVAEFLQPYPSQEMEAYPVSTRVNRPSFNDSLLIQPLPEEHPRFTATPTPNSI